MDRQEILNEVDPDWQGRFRGDIDLAWAHYHLWAPEEIARVLKEYGENKE